MTMADVSSAARQVLAAWQSQKPTFALMGEYSAGKSSLLNLLLGMTFLRTQVTATNMPVVWLTHGTEPRAQMLTHDGVLTPVEMADFANHGTSDCLLLRLELPADILKRCDIIDTPGISDPRLAAGSLGYLGDYLDFVVWCSPANQAWRQTEKAMWTSLPPALRDNSLMALTRADTIKQYADLRKVVKRCEREAAGLFRDYIPVGTKQAIAALSDEGTVSDHDAWRGSNADVLLYALDVSIKTATLACDARETIKLPQPASVRKTKPAAEKPQPTPKAAGAATVADVIAGLRGMTNEDNKVPLNDQDIGAMNHLFATITDDKSLSDEHRAALRCAMSLEQSADVSLNAVLLQLVRELEDFADTPWCSLGTIH